MGMDCHGLNGGGFSANFWVWGPLLEVATANGWEPKGTLECDLDFLHSEGGYARWPSRVRCTGPRAYTANCFQLVDEEDAANLADALERAIRNGAFDEDSYSVNKDTSSRFDLGFVDEIFEAVGQFLRDGAVNGKNGDETNGAPAFDRLEIVAHTPPPNVVKEMAVELVALARRGGFYLL